MINAHFEKVLAEHFPYQKNDDGTFVYCAKENAGKSGSGIFLIIDGISNPEAVIIYGNLATIAEPRAEYIRKKCDENDSIVTEMGTIQIADDELIWFVGLNKVAILTTEDPSSEIIELLDELAAGFAEKYQWAKKNLLVDDYDYLMSEQKVKGYNPRYDFTNQGEGMIFCTKYNTDAVYLINKKEKKVIQLVDEEGHMVAFTKEDVDPSLIELDVDSNNAEKLMAHYRFWVYDFKDGQAQIEWTVMPDGRYFADEDGYGAENCSELIAESKIDKNGKLLQPFTPLPRFRN